MQTIEITQCGKSTVIIILMLISWNSGVLGHMSNISTSRGMSFNTSSNQVLNYELLVVRNSVVSVAAR